jgi:hypothetical protein
MATQQAIPFEILHLNDEGYHLKIMASINDVQLSLILDTGASQTAFDTDYIRIVNNAWRTNLRWIRNQYHGKFRMYCRYI